MNVKIYIVFSSICIQMNKEKKSKEEQIKMYYVQRGRRNGKKKKIVKRLN